MNKYSTYKDSGVEWIGEVPEHWNTSKYKFHTDILSGFPFKSNLFNNEVGFPILRIRDITSGKTETYYKGDYDEQYIINNSDLLIGMDGDFNIRWWDNGKILLNQRCCSIKEGESVLRRFLYYVLPFDLQVINDLTYYTTVKHLSNSDIYNSSLVVPPLTEQQQIVAFLDNKTEKIDNLISHKQKKIDLLKEKRTALINHVVTKGLNPKVELKDSGVEWIGEIPSHYQMISIKFLVTIPITDGPHETPIFVDEGIPFLSVNGVVGNIIDFNKVRGYISEELHIQYSKKCKPQRDDVLLVKSGSTTGKSTIVETDLDFNIWSPLCIIRSDTNKILPRFTFQTFQSGYFRLLIENNWSYGTQPNIGMEVIGNLSIVVPPIKEQQEIINYLDQQTKEIDDLVRLEQKKIELLKEYRQSLISEVVTGKVRVCEEDLF